MEDIAALPVPADQPPTQPLPAGQTTSAGPSVAADLSVPADQPADPSPAQPEALPAPATITLDLTLAGKVNFASAQNGVSVIKRLVIHNQGTEPAENVRLTLTATPAILRERTWHIDRIAPGGAASLTNLDTPLDTVLLGGLDEAEIARLDLRLTAGDQDTTTTHQIELLARDEWGGVAEMDNILAAFVSPNHPFVARILKDAARLLEGAGHPGAIDGYQTRDPARAWMIAGAIWSAATGLGLTYAMPPASFEKVGQKIRDPERIAVEGLATCLDSTLLLAAAFEAAGLNAGVLFAKGHAWVGVWLVPRDFGRLVEPDVVTVRKAAAAREFVPLETTLLTRRPAVGFAEAVEAGRDRLSEDHEFDFVQVVDISRARAARIRPLASHRTAEADPAQPIDTAPAALPRPLDLGLLPGELQDEAPTTPLGRIARWQRQLLDLSLMNRLLNFKETRGAVPLICPDIPGAEDRLANGEVFRLLALKDENATAGRDLPPDEARRIDLDLARDALGRGQIAVPLTGRDMADRLTELYRRARSDLAEGGTNTLFLAVGFLRWKRSESDARAYRAPLLLLPVKLERRSAQSEFRLSQIEDEVRLNSTLLEMLKRDFEIRIPELEGELPRDAAGLDIPRILEIMRHRMRDVPGFEVTEDCAISTFSFSKYLMWKDLVDRTDNLRESRLVAHLVDNPTEAFAGARQPMPTPHDVDRKHAPADILAPLPADSSQLAAVLAAAEGRDFVLIGPPGTGKSQTITNIIADQLGRGRTVLFVAEKSAALDVVHRRLERHGLADAVLELHSRKADRKSVLEQLGRSWARASGASEHEWVRIGDDLRLTRDQLNTYVEALHRPGTQGFSVFQAIGIAAGGKPAFTLGFAGKDAHDEVAWRGLRDLAADLGARHRIIADLDPHGPLSLLDEGEWSFGWQDGYLAAARTLRAALQDRHRALLALAGPLGMDADAATRQPGAEALARLSRARLGARTVQPAALRDTAAARRDLAEVSAALERAHDARRALAASYPDARLADIPVDALEVQWREAQGRIWPLAGLARKKLRKLLQTYASAGEADPGRDLDALRQLVRARAELAASPLRELAGFTGEGTDTAALDAWITEAEQFRQLEQSLARDGIDTSRCRDQIAGADGGALSAQLAALSQAEAAVADARARFTDLGGALPRRDAAEALLDALGPLEHRFGDWLKWRTTRTQGLACGLAPLVEALEDGTVTSAGAAAAFERAYAAWWLRLAMDAAPCLRGFAHWQHDALIKRFRELDDALAALAPAEVMRRLGNSLPARDLVPRNSELGVLRQQLGLQRPSKAIRNLIAEMPTAFPKLAPCVLMSPLSVAQYLPAGQAQFDLVIFDEASQISTWDAIGAIARGRQAIIVGDPKQLPPTNFFGRSTDDAGDDEGAALAGYEKDMPSILDEVSAAGIPTQRLRWHYRSRDEMLIAFSNHAYYGDLITFPSPDASGQAVRLHEVGGIYQRGTGKTNPGEARAITAFVRKRLESWLKLPEDQRPTLGVITFNIQQQGLILDLLDAERKANPDLEWFFSDDREEPLIVKNLENIQGDERDVMLFSITFGPDTAGKITMNFGAMNGDGGEKRLNVAVTRARAELHVFASLGADQIDLSRTRARGVADLKMFLDFAKRGPVALPARDSGSVGPVESPFEEAVRDALAARGWDVRTQIGVSGFRIDLGVRHPDHAGAWLAGLECDGAQYHSSATARDRDRIRQAVLEGLGWSILRIWSTDWFRAPQATLDRVDEALRQLLEADRARRTAEAEARDKAEPQAEALPDPAPLPDGAETDPATDPYVPGTGTDAAPEDRAPAPVRLASGTASPGARPDPDRFFAEDYTPTLLELLSSVVAHGPISESALARTIAQAHGWQRTGTRIQARIAALHPHFSTRAEGQQVFLWPKDGVEDRTRFRGLSGRPLREISWSEIASVEDIHAAQVSAAPDPVAELARLLGIARLSRDAREHLGDARAWRLAAGG